MMNWVRSFNTFRLFFIQLLFFINFSLIFNCNGQRYNFTNYTIANGLPNNQVLSLFQDSEGLLWIGTSVGACRFDGLNFQKFDQNNLISNNAVKTIYQDSKGNIWIGMIRKGFSVFDGSSFKFYNSNNGLLSDNITSFCEDKSGKMWIGTSDGLSLFDGNNFESYTILKGLPGNAVSGIDRDELNRIWIATSGGISVFENNSFKNFQTRDGLASDFTYCIKSLGGKKIAIGTLSGLSVFDGTAFRNFSASNGLLSNHVVHVSTDKHNTIWTATYGGGVAGIDDSSVLTLTTLDGLPENIVNAICVDREGNYWFATTRGLSKYSGNRFHTYTTDDGLASDHILSAYCDDKNNIWFGTLAGGVSMFDGTLFKNFGKNDGLNSRTIWSIIGGQNGNFWFGTTSGPALLGKDESVFTYPVSYLNNFIIYSITESQNGQLFFATDKGLYIRSGLRLKKIGSDAGLKEEKVRAVFEDKNNVIWIGTLKGLFRLEQDQAIWFNEKQSLPKAPVTSILSDAQGNILFSTYDFGLYWFNPSDSLAEIRTLSRHNGLNNDRILTTVFDKNQNLWLGTPDGIDCINYPLWLLENKISITHFDKSNGYFGSETNTSAADSEGNIWFGTVNGAIKYNLKTGISRQGLPLVRLNKIQLFLKDVDWNARSVPVNKRTGLPDELKLSYNNNYLSFFFSGIYLTAPEEVQFSFMLEGFDSEWSPPTKQSVANYSNIPHGKFVFKVKASANKKDWSVPLTFPIEISPPIWKTPLFYVFYIVAGIGLILFFIRMRTRNLLRSRNMLSRKVEQRTTELNEKNKELEKLSLVASETDNAVMILDPNRKIEWVNPGFTRITGITLDEITGKSNADFSFLNSDESLDQALIKATATKESSHTEWRFRKGNENELWFASAINPIVDNRGQLKNIVVVNADITLRKVMEEQIRASLEEKGLLLKEIHHRVKNNLQIIISLFNLQSNFIQDEKAYKALREGQDRIKSMALIHDRFYQSDGTSRIDFDEYLKRLCENLFISNNISNDRIELKVIADKIALDIDTAVPCGLIVNELVTNALKHAFNDGMKGQITVRFHESEGYYQLEAEDNGSGFPAGYDIQHADSLGMQLICALADQLEGTITLETEPTTRIRIRFKKNS